MPHKESIKYITDFSHKVFAAWTNPNKITGRGNLQNSALKGTTILLI